MAGRKKDRYGENKAALSPLMEQYLAVKKQHPDKLLFFQVGDFYELFFEDAVTAARELEIALTSRDVKKDDRVPLAGIPIHAGESYFQKLLTKGFKLAVCDQVEEAIQAKGLIRREVTRIITPGTVIDGEMLEAGRNNYLVLLHAATVGEGGGSGYGLAAVDVSTGEFLATEARGEKGWESILDELCRLQPSEILCTGLELRDRVLAGLGGTMREPVRVEPVEPPADPETAQRLIAGRWENDDVGEPPLERYPLAAGAVAAALLYLEDLKHPAGRCFHSLEIYFPGQSMVIDSTTARNLELTQTLRDGEKRGSLLDLIDQTLTAMGRRLFRRWMEQPLRRVEPIIVRQEAVQDLAGNPSGRKKIRSVLKQVLDLERLASRLELGRVNARDLVSLRNSLTLLPELTGVLSLFQASLLQEIAKVLPDGAALESLIRTALVDDPPQVIREGGLFRAGYHPEIDRYRKISREGKQMLLDLEQRERKRSGIKSLKVGYNRNFGYYIEVTRANLSLVPPDFNRRQTLVNAERFITAELKELEEQISGAKENLIILEHRLFEALLEQCLPHLPDLREAALQIARLDCLQGLAETAERHLYRRPRITRSGRLNIVRGRHPVVEQTVEERFVPNDVRLSEKERVLIITGPNMAGKSTYCRMTALICIMAQMGGFVPAEEAVLPVHDRVFARVGAGDDLSRGRSTFMVEMEEAAVILRDATPQSLIILDEIGRGTSTYDGMSIARSVLEFIASAVRAKTLFSTHYHELTALEGSLPGVKNYTMAVQERGRRVIFLRQVVPGRSDKSYGINVARLAGLPAAVILRAEAVLAKLEAAAAASQEKQLTLLSPSPVAHESPASTVYKEMMTLLQEIDLDRITPLEAMQILHLLRQKMIPLEEGPAEEGKGK